jgi:hypothetical protein
MRTLSTALCLAVLAGCAPAAEPDAAPNDLRREFPTAPEGAYVIASPDYTIPASSERQMCTVVTYDGPDVGIVAQYNYQSVNGHHVTIFGTTATERELPDDTVWDCTETEDLNMASMEPILIGGSIVYQDDGVLNEYELPDGFGAPLKAGQRIILQSHYLNVTERDILVHDTAYFVVVPEEQITTWTAAFVNTVTNFTIPANTPEYTLAFDCGFDEEYSLLFLGGHLHEWGKSFKLEDTTAAGTETIYEVAEWEPVFRDSPMYVEYEEGEFTVGPENTFTTTCTWFNGGDEDIGFPQEMCVTFGMAYPTRVPVICSPD